MNKCLNRCLACILALLFFAQSINGQNYSGDSVSNLKVIGLEGHKGFIIIHSEEIRNIRNSYPTGFEINYNWHNLGKDAWRTCHCYPRTGFAFNFFDFDNPEVLGQGYTLAGFVEPYFSISDRFSFSFRAMCGLSYLTRPFDEKTNPRNLSYSLHVNGYLQLNTSLNYRLSPRWQLSLSANYNHLSNGGIEEPNKGINFPTASLGLDYTINPKPFPEHEKVLKDSFEAGHEWEVNIFGANKGYEHGSDKRFYIYGIQGFYNYQLSHLHALRIGGEWIVNNVAKAKMKENGQNITFARHHRGSLLAGHAFLLGKFRFSEQIGIYIHRPYDNADDVYQRYSLIYNINEHLHLGIGLKSHRHVADFLDIRAGYKF